MLTFFSWWRFANIMKSNVSSSCNPMMVGWQRLSNNMVHDCWSAISRNQNHAWWSMGGSKWSLSVNFVRDRQPTSQPVNQSPSLLSCWGKPTISTGASFSLVWYTMFVLWLVDPIHHDWFANIAKAGNTNHWQPTLISFQENYQETTISMFNKAFSWQFSCSQSHEWWIYCPVQVHNSHDWASSNKKIYRFHDL